MDDLQLLATDLATACIRGANDEVVIIMVIVTVTMTTIER
jgi:hypothetical protein